ncbi:conserved hypothetical protein [metagenome]|uniref:Uncharacterized protein n=1 Tax=metagenome TaxID=256318 RepID=A0A2P2C280_9ZZZZ
MHRGEDGNITARVVAVLAVILGCVAAGALLGWGWATATSTDPVRRGAAQPLEARLPSAPTYAPEAPYATDVSFPPLGTDLDYVATRIGGSAYAWKARVPKGWTTSVIGPNENKYLPPDGPVGGYGLRIELVLGQRLSPAALVGERLVAFRALFDDVHVLFKNDTTIALRYRDPQANWLRFNTFRWIPDVNGTAAVEVSVSGRDQDRPGMDALMSRLTESLEPAD